MTDEQLQSLFEGMQRNLGAQIAEFEQRVNKRFEETEQRYSANLEAIETKLVTEFWKWARIVEARLRMVDDINPATLERLNALEQRVSKLDRPLQ